MSWFDKLFGEQDNPNKDYLNKRSHRRQKAKYDNQHTLLPQNNDIYERPKGKFRFPMRVLEEEQRETTSHDDMTEKSFTPHQQEEDTTPSRSRKRHRHRVEPHVEEHNNDTPSFERASASTRTRRQTQPNSSHQRKSIQTEALRAHSNRSQDTQPRNYATREFKASEVPSAIFGTHQRRKLDNGVIPPVEEDNAHEDSRQNISHNTKDNDAFNHSDRELHERSESSETNAQSTKTSQNEAPSQSERSGQHNEAPSSRSTASSNNRTSQRPNTRARSRNNTINIENIYASQIVEEIRRERERKVLQKRQFKKALQQKRQQQHDEEEDSVQRAIDEMYANQAKRYIGESSLDEDADEQEQLQQGEMYNEVDEDTPSHFNYEEVNLDDVRNVQQVDDSDVTVDATTTDSANDETANDSSSESHQLSDEGETADQSEDESEMHDVEEKVEDVQEAPHVSQENHEDSNSNVESQDSFNQQEVTDAQYRDLDEDESKDEAEDLAGAEEVKSADQTASSEESMSSENGLDAKEDNDKTAQHQKDAQLQNDAQPQLEETDDQSSADSSDDVFDQTVDAERQDEATVTTTDQTQQKQEQSDEQVATTTGEQEDEKQEKSSHSEERNHDDQQSQPQEQKVQHATPKQKPKIRKGAKPFNVLMTPSDRKRAMDRKKKDYTVKEPELKPEMNSSQTERTQTGKAQSSQGSTQQPTSSEKTMSSENETQKSDTQEAKTNTVAETETHNQPQQQNENTTHAHTDTSHESSEAHHRHEQDVNNHLGVETDTQYRDTEALSSSQEDMHEENEQNQQNEHHQPQTQQPYTQSSQEMSGSQDDAAESDHSNALNMTDAQQTGSAAQQSETSSTQQPKQQIRKGPNLNLPNINLLEEPEAHEIDEAWINEKKEELNDAFYYFNVPAEVQHVTEGPSVTRFELSVEKGVKVSRITALQDDIKMALAAKDIRIEAPIPGTSLVGIEVPNNSATKVNLRSIIETDSFKNAESKLTVAMGYRINNEPLLMDIAKTPHALIAGATGSGKSVCINSILMSLLYKNHPEELRLLLIDPKMVELAPYNDLPHLVSPVITDVKAATQSLKWAVDEMERRYKLFAKYHVRNISAFNKKAAYEDRMPKIVIVIDELADLMMMSPQEVEQSIARIAQKARACGIHMLVATQRPSVNVITGLIKANIPTRIAFMVSSSVDSRTILDCGGAERLLGYGDMLYLGSGMNKPIRVQGTFVSDEEIDEVVDYIKKQREPDYLFEEQELLKKNENQPKDELFMDVCHFMVQEGNISTSLIQRHFQIGYNRAARIVDQLEQLGYISGANGSKPRDVYITEADLEQI
ncbi:DNA translocase FtsK [Staphylococcus argensis]|uniref:DNA translocase FtsK n=1 Tax=Staphylococcus argensis TaxID=1607738 RepID=A0A2K4FFX5_9STAP|nr:DNA translocase FtsK [Staphylococcus argensis]MCY6990736.1 FtsK/SpoIIIE domain-containing protein [Staphylococcus argensis]POA10239.1 DNA translocase FtsK [Staphylococcus argensis]